jgi:hypothetical protein
MPTARAGYFSGKEKVPSVTQIGHRFEDSGGLIYWGFEQGKAFERGEIKGLYEKRDLAGDSGTLAHYMVECHLNKEPVKDLDKYPVEIANAAQQGFENYIRWQEDNRIVIVEQELQMVSEVHKFGGCPDAIGIDSRGEVCLLDYKTSSKGPFVGWMVQIAGYKILWEENHPAQPITGGFHLLKFSKENGDFSHFHWRDLADAEEQFLLFRRAFEIDKKLKKRV